MSTDAKVIVTSEDKILSLLKASLKDILHEELPQVIKKAQRKDFLSLEELQELTGFSYGKIRYLRESGQLEYTQSGKSIIYPTDAVYKYLEDNRIKTDF